jgi:hypothetical protein
VIWNFFCAKWGLSENLLTHKKFSEIKFPLLKKCKLHAWQILSQVLIKLLISDKSCKNRTVLIVAYLKSPFIFLVAPQLFLEEKKSHKFVGFLQEGQIFFALFPSSKCGCIYQPSGFFPWTNGTNVKMKLIFYFL